MQCFDSIYDDQRNTVIESYNRLLQSRCDPVRLLTFTAMLPVLLLDSEVREDADNPDSFMTFVEFVAKTSAYRVHPVVRLASWVCYIVVELKNCPSLRATSILTPDVDEVIATISMLDIVDQPSFFPLLLGLRSSAADLNACDTLVYPLVRTLDGIYEALARHEPVDWNDFREQCARSPITSVDALLRIANPSIVAPETVLMHLTPQNVFGLLQREQRQLLRGFLNRSVGGVPTNANVALRALVLSDYPSNIVVDEGDVASPYFWSVWQNTITQPLAVDTWINYVTERLPSRRFTEGDSVEFSQKLLARFVMWAGSYGHSAVPFPDAPQRTVTCLQVLARLAVACLTAEQLAQWVRLDFVAPAMRVPILGVRCAFEVATFKLQLPHALWPRDMKLMARLGNRNTILTKDEALELFTIMGDAITSDNALPRVIGAMLQSMPAGSLPRHLQQQLLNSKTIVSAEHLCQDVNDDVIVKNVSDELLHRINTLDDSHNAFLLQGVVSEVLQQYVDLQNQIRGIHPNGVPDYEDR
jgi:hypothetical protein